MVSHRLRQLRMSKGFTLDQLAEISGVNRGTIHRIELDQVSPRLDTLELLCRALGTGLPGFFQPPSSEAGDDGSGLAVPGPGAPPDALGGFRSGVLDWLGHLEALFHHSADGFAVVDPSGMICFESQVSRRLRGDEAGNREAHPWYDTVHPEDRPALVAGMAAVLRNASEPVRLECRTPAGEGAWRWVRATLRNQMDHPAIQGIVLNLQDITDWRDAEAQRWQMQKLDSQLQVVKVMTAEFSNLLMGFQGHLDVLRLNGMEPRRLAGMQESLDRASRMLHRMRDISGHPALDRRPLDLNRLVQDQMEARQRRSGGNESLVVHLEPRLPEVSGDRELLGRLVQHLLDHLSAAAEGKRGTFEVSTALLELSPEEVRIRFPEGGPRGGGRFVVLEAHGPAGDPSVDHLDPAGLEGIFSPGRADQMISRAAALRTVRDHGGVLEETRTVEEGIRLRAILPIGPAPVQAVADASEKRGAGMILVVDDESYILSALCQMIEALGHRALPAHGGQEALDLHAQHGAAIRLVLLDLNMPIVDGEAVYRELKRRDPGLRIVLCTGSTAPSTEQERQYGDMAGILRKPFRYEDLRSVVEAVLV